MSDSNDEYPFGAELENATTPPSDDELDSLASGLKGLGEDDSRRLVGEIRILRRMLRVVYDYAVVLEKAAGPGFAMKPFKRSSVLEILRRELWARGGFPQVPKSDLPG